MLNTIKYSLPSDLEFAVNAEAQTCKTEDKISRIWAKDATVWTGDDEAKWLGWLDIVAKEIGNVDKYNALHRDIVAAGFRDVLLRGMGGSSLCPEVLAMTFGKANFHILDSTVPAQVKTVESKLDLTKTLFIVASKSGSTLEPNCFKQYFFELVAEKVGRENAGRQFIAITDPGSKMEQVAKNDGFRHIFYGDPEIGGRFSALSAFGITAGAAMGLDVEQFLHNASEMVDACRDYAPSDNPGALLGLILGACHAHGRDKLTIFTSPEIHDLGAWLEQLVAESTGKKGVAIIPVDREPARPAASYGNDRIFAFLGVKGDARFDEQRADLEAAGHPSVTVQLDSIDNLGQEFFRWEFATAVAGAPSVHAGFVRRVHRVLSVRRHPPSRSGAHVEEGVAVGVSLGGDPQRRGPHCLRGGGTLGDCDPGGAGRFRRRSEGLLQRLFASRHTITGGRWKRADVALSVPWLDMEPGRHAAVGFVRLGFS